MRRRPEEILRVVLCCLAAILGLSIFACQMEGAPDCFTGKLANKDMEGVWADKYPWQPGIPPANNERCRFLVLGPEGDGVEYSIESVAGEVQYSVDETSWTLSAGQDCSHALIFTRHDKFHRPSDNTFEVLEPGGWRIQHGASEFKDTFTKLRPEAGRAFRQSLPEEYRALWPVQKSPVPTPTPKPKPLGRSFSRTDSFSDPSRVFALDSPVLLRFALSPVRERD